MNVRLTFQSDVVRAVTPVNHYYSPRQGGLPTPQTRHFSVNLGFEHNLVDTALRDSAFNPREAIPQVLSAAQYMVALTAQLFHNTQILGSLWFLAKNKAVDANCGLRERFEVEYELALAA